MNTSAHFLSFDLFSLRKAYLDRSITVSEVIQEVLGRTRDFKGHNIWISLHAESTLMAQAKKLEDLDPQDLPLYGIPFAVKDNIDCVGLPTTAACPGFSYLPAKSAFVVQKLIDAGAVLIGKTNMDQFATGLTGTRSPKPYGICKNSINPDYISGGSSSGSAVAVALNIVSFSLGTDTAGSGRVPAGFNNIVGLKPTRGLLSCSGVVPACKSLDCVSIFSQTIAEAEYLFDIVNAYDTNDSYARNDRQLLDASIAGTAQMRFGVPKPEQLKFFGDPEGEVLFAQTIAKLQTLGEVVEIDFQPFLEAAALLYEGPWIAERYAGIRPFIESHPEQLHPVIMEVLAAAKDKNAIAAFDALHRLQQLKRQTATLLQGLSCIVVPTAPRIYRIEEVLADPIRLNSNLGYYTNYMNLLDLSAVAIPAGFYANALPFGITLFSMALSDARLLGIAKGLESARQTASAPAKPANSMNGAAPGSPRYQRIAVCGAHMQGLPLNPQLLDLGARFYATARTSANYRLHALAIAPPERPGLVRDDSQGQSIALELWELPKENWASFISNIKSPLCIGSVEMVDGSWEYGFLCEPYPLGKSVDITGFGGWRNYLKNKA
ncbi:MAG: allophanate hydrolase [Methylovulum miyakonense]|uniref:allophanate hydrolase n=1 Tax=Methylovulum miyakonense TaxID=645578 RepID=UPI003BB5E047